MMLKNFIQSNFLSELELSSFKYDDKEQFASESGDLILYYQVLPDSVIEKIRAYIGKDFSIRDVHIHDLKQPYRLHCDSGKENKSYYTIIVPLDKEPQGGIYIMNQWADQHYSLDNYYTQDFQPVLSFEERKEKIHEFDLNVSLPDIVDFDHIKDKRGFSIKEYIKYEYNQVVIFPSKYFHCSQNVENFTSKKSLAMFTDA
jgi:hypothetical protein